MMPGWITYPGGKGPGRRMPVIFIPALHSRWMLLAGDFRENQKPLLEKKASIGFFCGLLSDQAAGDYPALSRDLEYFMEPYDPVYLMTSAALDLSIRISVADSGLSGTYGFRDVLPGGALNVRGSLPVSPAVTVYECRYFGFSPYILKEK